MFDILFNASRNRSAAGDGWRNSGGQSMYGGRAKTRAGVSIDENVAMTYSACWCATRVIAETISALPKRVVRIADRQPVEHYLNRMLSLSPNSDMSAQPFREGRLAQQINSGNGFAEIQWDRYGQKIQALWPIHCSRVTPVTRDNPDGYTYSVRNNNGSPVGFTDREILHLPGAMSSDGRWGLGVIAYARETIGFALSVERHGSDYFNAGGQPRGVITGMEFKDKEQGRLFRKDWKDMIQQRDSSQIALLPSKDANYVPLMVSNEDSQFILTRTTNVTEICRWYRIAPHLLHQLDRATNNNIEAQGMDFVTYTLLVWLVRDEQECTRKLLTEAEQETLCIEHDLSGLLRGDQTTRMNSYRTALAIGIYTINQVCAKEGLPNIGPAGDVNYVPLNMTTAGYMLEHPEPSAAKSAAGANDNGGDNGGGNTGGGKSNKATAAVIGSRGNLTYRDVAKLVLTEATERLLTKEANAVKRKVAAKMLKADFADWVSEFHEGHLSTCVESLVAASMAMKVAGVDVPTDRLAAALIRQSRSKLLQLSATPTQLSSKLETWAVDMSAEFAQTYFTE